MLKKYKNNNLMILIIIILVFIIAIMLIVPMKSKTQIKHIVKPNKENIVELLNNITDNYSLEVEKTINYEKKTVFYSKDKDIVLFEGDYGADGYLSYKGKIYELNASKDKLSKSKISIDKIEDRYYDIDFLKKIVNYCELEYVTNVKALCKIKYSDYLKEYNELYNSDININYDDIMELYIVHYKDRIGKFIIDYSNINKIITNENDKINYGIKIVDINKNDFSKYIEHYKKQLSK